MKEKLNETQESSREELYWLKAEVSREFKEFKVLSNDKNVINWMKKVFDKCWNYVIETMWKWAENVDVGQEMQDILKNHKDLWLYISQILKLPLENAKFSELSVEQKINYLALHDAFRYRRLKKLRWHKEPTNANNIIRNCNANLEAYQNMINSRFRWYNLNNFLRLENTLKEDFWLTNIESQQLKKYLLLVKEHPEYLKTILGEIKVQPQLASSGNMWWYIAIGLASILSFLLWAAWMHYIDNIWKMEVEEKTRIDGVTKIENPEAVLKLITREANFETPERKKELTPRTDDQLFFQITRKIPLLGPWLEEKYKDAQTREIIMQLEWRLAMQFDLKKWSQIDIDAKDWKGVVYVQLPYPDVITTKTAAKVKKVDRELVHVEEYEQGQEELRQELEQQAIEDAKNNPEFYKQGEEDVARQLYDLFSTVYAPAWLKVTEVHVRFFDPEEWPKDFTDPEGKRIVDFK